MKLTPTIQQLQATFEHLSKRERLILYLAGAVIGFMVVDRLVISPFFYKLKALDKEIAGAETGIKTGAHILAQKDRIIAESARYDAYYKSSASAEEETTILLKEVENLANKTSVYLVDLKPAGVVELDMSKKFLVNLTCEAQITQIADFMFSVENAPKLMIVDKYQISPKSRESSVAKCTMTISKIVIP